MPYGLRGKEGVPLDELAVGAERDMRAAARGDDDEDDVQGHISEEEEEEVKGDEAAEQGGEEDADADDESGDGMAPAEEPDIDETDVEENDDDDDDDDDGDDEPAPVQQPVVVQPPVIAPPPPVMAVMPMVAPRHKKGCMRRRKVCATLPNHLTCCSITPNASALMHIAAGSARQHPRHNQACDPPARAVLCEILTQKKTHRTKQHPPHLSPFGRHHIYAPYPGAVVSSACPVAETDSQTQLRHHVRQHCRLPLFPLVQA